MARAVARLSVLSELCLPLVKVGGTFIAMKGAATNEEIENGKYALEVLGGELKRCLRSNYRLKRVNVIFY